jgi:hypothetical protein
VGHRGDVFVRSLHSNGRVSTTKARPEDWRDLLELCFNNREADIGAFFRRQLSGAVPSTLHDILAGLLANRSPKTTRPTEIAYNLLERGTTARNAAVEIRRRVDPDALGFIQLGTWDVALAVLGELPRRLADREFLNLISSSNPDYTGWPVWLDSRTFSNERNRPQVRQDGWEALIVSKEEWLSNHADFIRIEPPSSFYLSRVIPDDLVEKSKGIRPGSVFDANLHTYRTAEAIAVGLAFGRALTTALESTTLVFVFRWTKLRHRKLGVWANPLAYGPGGAEAIDDEVTTDVEVPLETVPSAIAPFVHSVMRHVVAKFDGYVYPLETVEQLVSNLVARRR